MKYKYIPGFPNHPIEDINNLLEAYEHIGEEIRTHTLTFIGRIHGLLHRVRLEPLTQMEIDNVIKTIYSPVLTPLKRGEVVDVATHRDIIVLASSL